MKLPEGYVNGVFSKPSAMGGFGQSMLERMGWRKGDGLGKERQGRSAPIEVKKKDDSIGLGGRFSWDWAHDYASSAFDGALASMNAGCESSSSSDSDSSDDEPLHAPHNRDGTKSSASAAELRLAHDLAKDNNLGRFGGRGGKLARIREQEARLAASTAVGSSQPAAAQASAPQATSAAPGSQPRGRFIVVQLPGEQVRAVPSEPPVAVANWWGQKRFHSAGWLESMEAEAEAMASRDALVFDEDTQAALFTRLTEQQSKGKRGMGKRAAVIGGGWQGTKTTFGEDSSTDNSSVSAKTQVSSSKCSKRKHGCIEQEGSPKRKRCRSAKQSSPVPSAQVLEDLAAQQGKRRMKAAKLERKLVAALALDSKAVAKQLRKRVKSGSVELTGPWVQLVAA